LTEAPQDLAAERAVLAAMMLDRAAAERAAEVIDPLAFYRVSHRLIFEALSALTGREESADIVTVCAELRKRGNLAAVGGEAAIAGLFDEITTAANLERHAAIVKDKHTLRRLAKTASEIREQALSGGSTADAMSHAEAKLSAIMDHKEKGGGTLAHGAKRFADSPARPDERPTPIMGGGVICAADLVLLAGKPGLGKSRLAIELAFACARGEPWLGLHGSGRPLRVGYLAAEFTRYRWWRRCVRLYSNEPAPEDPAQLQYIYLQLGPGPIVATRDMLDEAPDLSTDAGAAQLERLIKDNALELVMLDPLSRLMGDHEETNETFAALVRRLDRVR